MSKPHFSKESSSPRLSRQMGLLTLVATGACSMLGASINVVPFMIQRNVPGIGSYVLPAFAFAAIPAILAALAYGILSSAMPRAGGSYLYASRGLNPYLGFIASFSQWFGLSIVIGVIAYICVPFIQNVTLGLGWDTVSSYLSIPAIRVLVALSLIWLFVAVNISGNRSYEFTLLPMMFLMFALGAIVIVSGLIYDQQDFLQAVKVQTGQEISPQTQHDVDIWTFLSASALLFSSFIGFDAIAQAGGEAKNPSKTLPRAILLAILSVGLFYLLFSGSVYHIIPWNYIAEQAMTTEISAPSLLSYLLPSSLAIAILAGAAIALINDLPAMLLSVSRLMFAWSEDGIFPSVVAKIHRKRHTPHIALIAAGLMASVGVLGSHFAGDFFLGIDIMVTSMMVNFLLMCITLITFPNKNPTLASRISVIKNRRLQLWIGWAGILFLTLFLVVHTYKDLTSGAEHWYFYSTPVWLLVMSFASVVFIVKRRWFNDGENLKFTTLPEE